MLQLMKITAMTLLIGLGMQTIPATAQDAYSTKPVTNHGKKWRIGYYEGGSYINYPINLRTIVAGLAELGWMDPVAIPAADDQTLAKPLWDYLVRHIKSDYIQFVADGFWSCSWDSEKRKQTKEEIIQRLNQNKDIDFMIAMGTWAGKDLATDRHHTPTMVLSASDPLSAGIIKSVEDSGFEHLHAAFNDVDIVRQFFCPNLFFLSMLSHVFYFSLIFYQ